MIVNRDIVVYKNAINNYSTALRKIEANYVELVTSYTTTDAIKIEAWDALFVLEMMKWQQHQLDVLFKLLEKDERALAVLVNILNKIFIDTEVNVHRFIDEIHAIMKKEDTGLSF